MSIQKIKGGYKMTITVMELIIMFLIGVVTFILMFNIFLRSRITNLERQQKLLKDAIQRRCVCTYSKYCRPSRQHLQCIFREDGHYDVVSDCEFYKVIFEKENRRDT
jgi:hypothetical protein